MSKDNKFINEALSDIEDATDHEESTLEIVLDEELIEAAKNLQKVLGLSKDVFFNVLSNYGAYCCSKNDFDEDEFPQDRSGTTISFSISTESETALEKHNKFSNELITVFGLIKMSQKLL